MNITSFFNNDSHRESQLAYDYFDKIIHDSRYGFFFLHEQKELLDQTKKLYQKFKDKEYFVQIGIGGSALGPQMLIKALQKNSTRFIFLDNTDPDDTLSKLEQLDLNKTVFYVVSKSGGTAETIANFIICRNYLIQEGLSKKEVEKSFVFCTDPEQGQFREYVQSENLNALDIPSNIGGRFSVLSPVGLFPALFAGIQIDELLKGSEAMAQEILKFKQDSDVAKLAAQMANLYLEKKVTQLVFMPYSSKLSLFSQWLVQLWSESLGKINTEQKHMDASALVAYGATDQHSQMQLFMQGPANKLLLLLKINKFQNHISLNNDLPLAASKNLSSFSLDQLIHAQFEGTTKALTDQARHLCIMNIEMLNEQSMGSLILFFESLTVMMSYYLKVNPFDQPGVELGKKFAFEFLNLRP